jgi:hypothetical protein
MSAHLHIANNYNDVVDVITSLIAIYERNITVEPTLQQAINKQQEHTQIVSKLYHSLLPMLNGCSAIELTDLHTHYNDLKRAISQSFAVDLEYPRAHRAFDPNP